jgi:uncharacterized protein (DUF2141 family)
MKNLVLIGALFNFFSVYSQTGTITLNVEGIRYEQGGDVYAALFTEENFPVTGKHVIGAEAPVAGAKMQLVFQDVPPGWYGIAVFQDIDKNKELTTNLVGLPKEPFGFSNDARIRFGPPSFDNAKVRVDQDGEAILSITLK